MKFDPKKIAVYSLFCYAACAAVSITLAEIFFILALLLWAADIVKTKTNPLLCFTGKAAWFFAAFAVWHLICALAGVDPLNSIKDSRKIYLMLMFFLASYYIASDEIKAKAARFLALGAAFTGLYAISTGIYHRIIMHDNDFRAVTFSGNHMHAGGLLMLLSVSLSAFMLNAINDYEKNKKDVLIFSVSFILAIGGLLFTFTRGSWIAAFSGILISAFLTNKRAMIAFVIAAAVAGFLMKDTSFMQRLKSSFNTNKGTSAGERVLMWKSGINIIKDNPITGIGTGNLGKVYEKYRNPESFEKEQGHLHNNIIQLGVINGIPGIVLYLALFGILLFSAAGKFASYSGAGKAAAAASVSVIAAFFINGFFEYNLFSSQVALLFWFITGTGEGKN